MAPKKAPPKGGKKKSTEEEAKARADAVDDIYDDEFKKTLRLEARKLEDMIKKEEGQIASEVRIQKDGYLCGSFEVSEYKKRLIRIVFVFIYNN